MNEVYLHVWWTFGRDDGGSYDDTIKLDDEDYLKLAEYYIENDEIPSSEYIRDEEIKKIVEDIEASAFDNLEFNSRDGYEGNEEEDEDGNKIDFDDWYDKAEKYVEISIGDYDYIDGEYRFRINISNGGESFVDYEINSLERFLIDKADDEDRDYGEVKGLEDFYKGIMKAAREKLEEDLDLTGDDPNTLDDLTFTVSLDE